MRELRDCPYRTGIGSRTRGRQMSVKFQDVN